MFNSPTRPSRTIYTRHSGAGLVIPALRQEEEGEPEVQGHPQIHGVGMGNVVVVVGVESSQA